MSQSARLAAVCVFVTAACEVQNRAEMRRQKLSVDYHSRAQSTGSSEEARREAERREAEQRRTEKERQDSELETSLAQAEGNAERAAGEPREAFEFAELVIKSYDTESVKSGRVVLSASAEKAAALLDLAIKANRAQAPALLLTKGRLWGAAGKAELAEAGFRASLVAKPRLDVLLALFQASQGRLSSAEVKGLCKRTRPYVATDEERFALFEASLRYGHSLSVESGLSWTSPDDLAWYKREVAERAERKRAAEESVLRAEEQCRVEAELRREQRELEQEAALRAEAEDRRHRGALWRSASE
jgi:hypothetical protein